jgi:hypothetical protein
MEHQSVYDVHTECHDDPMPVASLRSIAARLGRLAQVYAGKLDDRYGEDYDRNESEATGQVLALLKEFDAAAAKERTA